MAILVQDIDILDVNVNIDTFDKSPAENFGVIGEVIVDVLDLYIDRDLDVFDVDQLTATALVESRGCLCCGNGDSKDCNGNGDELHVCGAMFRVRKVC